MKTLMIAALSLTLLAGCGVSPAHAPLVAPGALQASAQSASSESAWFDAADASDLAKLKDLLAKGVSVNARDEDKNTALHYAVGRERVDVATFLLSKGADVNAKGYRDQTPLYNAVGRMNPDMVKLLLDKGARVDVVTQSGWTIFDNVSQDGGKKRKQILAMLQEAAAKQGKSARR